MRMHVTRLAGLLEPGVLYITGDAIALGVGVISTALAPPSVAAWTGGTVDLLLGYLVGSPAALAVSIAGAVAFSDGAAASSTSSSASAGILNVGTPFGPVTGRLAPPPPVAERPAGGPRAD